MFSVRKGLGMWAYFVLVLQPAWVYN